MNTLIPPQLRWACRRGMLELDVLLGNFLNEAFLGLDPTAQKIFVNLLDCQDQDLFMWLTGKEIPADPDLLVMVNQIRQHAKIRQHT